MSMEAVRTVLGPFQDVPAVSVIVIAACVLAMSAIALVLAERYRMVHASAKKTLLRLELSQKLLDGNEEYDIRSVDLTSDRDVMAARKTVRHVHAATATSVAACALVLLSALVLAASRTTFSVARDHGYRDGWDVSHAALWEDIDASPKEDVLPADLTGSIVFYYKFGCDDCNALGQELDATLSALAPVYRVATRSETGIAMIERYPVASVPACVYFRPNGTQLYYVLYEDTPDGPVVNDDAIMKLSLAVAYDVAAGSSGAYDQATSIGTHTEERM